MFEAALLSHIRNDAALDQYLSVYQGGAAVFSEEAPEGVLVPYVIFSISRLMETGSPSVELFNVYVDYFDNTTGTGRSRADSRKAGQRLEFLLDQVNLTSDRYDTIRLFMESGGPVNDPDPRVIHYNLQFSARAGRKAWANQL